MAATDFHSKSGEVQGDVYGCKQHTRDHGLKVKHVEVFSFGGLQFQRGLAAISVIFVIHTAFAEESIYETWIQCPKIRLALKT